MRYLVAVLVVLLAACAEPALSPNPTRSPTPSATATIPSRDFTDIVVAPEAAPPGTTYNGTGQGRPVLTEVVVSGRDAQFLALPGFVDGRYNTFSGEGGALLSLALRFDTVQHSEQAFDLFLEEFGSADGYGLDSDAPAGLGDEGTCAEGPVPTPLGEEAICLWRNGTLVLIAGGAMDADDMHAIAEGMDARAR